MIGFGVGCFIEKRTLVKALLAFVSDLACQPAGAWHFHSEN